MDLLRHFIWAALVCACGISTTWGVTAVSPSQFTNVDGDSNNGDPFNLGLLHSASGRYQQVYASSEFNALGHLALITQIAFRVKDDAFSAVLPNVQIDLSTTSAAVGSLSLTFADNVGADDTMVHSGALSLSSTAKGLPNGSLPFDITIPLTTPFLYNPTKGNLLMDVRNFGGGTSAQFDFDNTAPTANVVERLFTTTGNVNDPSTNNHSGGGLVTQFTALTPEPADMGALFVAIITCARRRNRRGFQRLTKTPVT